MSTGLDEATKEHLVLSEKNMVPKSIRTQGLGEILFVYYNGTGSQHNVHTSC